MDESRLPESLRRRLAEQASMSDLDVVRRFLASHFGDADGPADARRDMERLASVNTRSLRRGLEAIQAVLADPPEAGLLSRMVAWDANWPLDDPSDAGAAAFLAEVADMVREVLATAGEPPHRA
jgi:hypothetical protein